jgi:hypothetical protein
MSAMALRLPVRLALAAVGIAGVVMCVLIYGSYMHLSNGFTDFQQRRVASAVREFHESRSAIYPNVLRDAALGNALLVLGHPHRAEAVMLAATRRWPRDVRPWVGLAGAQDYLGRTAAARRSWRRARRLEPLLPPDPPPIEIKRDVGTVSG